MNPMALDLETVGPDGRASFRWWEPGFRILSLSLAWRDGLEIRNWFSADPATIMEAVRRLAQQNRPLVVHNLAFEKGVLETLFPDLKFNWYADTMRLGQLHDNGGDWRDQLFLGDELDEENSPDLGLSLEAVASRILQRDLRNHKDERDEYLRSLGIRSKFGSHIHLLPSSILERYNNADTAVTLEIFETIAPLLDGVWQKDWDLYYLRTHLMNSAYRRGIKCDTDKLQKVIYDLDRQVDEIEAAFVSKYRKFIDMWAIKTGNLTQDFNVGSNKQLKELFCGIMGMRGAHLTAKGEEKVKSKELDRGKALEIYPSFQSKHLSDWGEAGEMLKLRRKRLLVLSQTLNALEMAKQGKGRVHPEQKVAGTRTNRVSGGLND